jgi:hypothetical protein
MNDEIYENLTGFWQKVIDDLVKSFKEKYEPFSRSVTQQLIGDGYNAIPVKVQSEGFEITIYMPNYYIFMDEGVSGAVNNKGISRFKYKNKIPPISAIRLFMQNRTIVGEDFRKARSSKGKNRQSNIDNALNKVAYAIAYKIWRDGLPKTNFFSDVVNEKLLTKFENEIVNDYSQLIIDSIKLK